jgi:hypothetical protein
MSEAVAHEKKPPKPVRLGNGGVPPPPGRPKGLPNKLTRTLREAVEIAARDCHPQGLAGWLVERAQGGVQDRAIFAGMVGKVIPLQVNANVDGGIRLELGRSVGTPATQLQQQQPQALDLQRDPDGMYRIIDPGTGQEVRANSAAAEPDPPPPVDRQGGDGG